MSKSRNWCFTRQLADREAVFVENCAATPTLEDLWFAPVLTDQITGYVFQIEKAPSTGKLHCQGFIQFKNTKAMSTAKNAIGGDPHMETMKGTVEEAVAYCKKEESRYCGPYECGAIQVSRQGKRTDLEALREMVKERKPALEIIEEDAKFARYEKQINFMRFAYMEAASDRQATGVAVKVFYGATGLGKTFAAINYVCHNKDYYVCEAPSQAGGKIWFQGYEGQKTLIIDDFAGNFCTVDYLKRLLDCYKLKVEFKGGFVWANWTTVVITSNYHPANWYDNVGLHVVNVEPLRRRLNKIYEFLPDRLYHEVQWDGTSIGDDLETKSFGLPLLAPVPDVVEVISSSDEETQVVSPPPKKRKLVKRKD